MLIHAEINDTLICGFIKFNNSAQDKFWFNNLRFHRMLVKSEYAQLHFELKMFLLKGYQLEQVTEFVQYKDVGDPLCVVFSCFMISRSKYEHLCFLLWCHACTCWSLARRKFKSITDLDSDIILCFEIVPVDLYLNLLLLKWSLFLVARLCEQLQPLIPVHSLLIDLSSQCD